MTEPLTTDQESTPHKGLTPAEVGRKGYHLLGLLIPLIYLYSDVPRLIALIVVAGLWIVAAVFDVVRLNVPSFNEFALRFARGLIRQEEKRALNGMVFYMLAAFLVILFWERWVAALSLIVLVVGDSFAALVGLAWGRHKIWGGKSLEGSLACLCSVFLICLLFIPPDRALAVAIITTLVESLPTVAIINDNFFIPLASSAALVLTYQLW